MKTFLIKAARVALPVAVVVVRILFAEGRDEFERSIQQGLRSVASVFLRRFGTV